MNRYMGNLVNMLGYGVGDYKLIESNIRRN